MIEPKFFDIHSHPNFADFDNDRDEVVRRALDNGMWLAVVGTDQESSSQALTLTEKYEKGVYAIVGAHPTTDEEFDYEFYKKLATNPKVVAIGECGLDYFHNTNKKQEEIFRKQIELANEMGKPLMLHLRNPSTSSGQAGAGCSAYDDAFKLLPKNSRGDLHFFAGSIEEAKPFLDAGFYFSFTGVITFARNYDEIIKYLPLERIMAETDCPFVAPVPFRGKRNEPLYVTEVVKKIAEIRGEDSEKVRKQLLKNSFAFFDLKL